MEGFSVAETAEMIGITPINVKVRLSRAKNLLQKELEKYYSKAQLYDFNLVYCDILVKNVFDVIVSGKGQCQTKQSWKEECCIFIYLVFAHLYFDPYFLF